MSNIIDHADAPSRDAAVNEFLRFSRALRRMVPPLIKMAKADDGPSRVRALQALGAIRSANDATIQTFSNALEDPVVEVRLAAVNGLCLVPWRAPVALPGLCKCLGDPSLAVRERAATVLGSFGPAARPALEALGRCAHENEGPVGAAARQAMEKIRSSSGPTGPKEEE